MSAVKRVLFVSVAMLLMSASAALAATKYQANLVATTLTNPKIENKGKIQVKDNGDVKVGLKGVTDGSGLPVTTSQSWKDTKFTNTSAVDGTQYMVILKLKVMAVPADAETVIPVDLKKGNGSTKLSLADLMGMLDALGDVVRSMEITGAEVWGPLGSENVAACQTILGIGYTVTPDDPSCRGGALLGVGGIYIP